jgi:hypothetical protein
MLAGWSSGSCAAGRGRVVGELAFALVMRGSPLARARDLQPLVRQLPPLWRSILPH